MDRKCILALLRSLSILDLIGFDVHIHFQSWILFCYQIYLRSFCIIFSETHRLLILVRPSLVTDRISLGFWLNISFIINYRWAFGSIVAIAIDLLTSKDRYFLWIAAVPLPRRCLQSRQHSGSPMHGVTLALSGPPNLWPESDHSYLILLLFHQPITSPKLYLPSVWSVVLVQTQLQYIQLSREPLFFSASPRTSNPPFLLVGCDSCWRQAAKTASWLRNDLSIPRAPENMSHKIIITIHFHIWT